MSHMKNNTEMFTKSCVELSLSKIFCVLWRWVMEFIFVIKPFRNFSLKQRKTWIMNIIWLRLRLKKLNNSICRTNVTKKSSILRKCQQIYFLLLKFMPKEILRARSILNNYIINIGTPLTQFLFLKLSSACCCCGL